MWVLYAQAFFIFTMITFKLSPSMAIDLVTVFDAILTSTQTGEKFSTVFV